MRKEAKMFTKKKHHPTRPNINKHRQTQRQVQKKFRQEYWNYINGVLFPAASTTRDEQESKKTLWNYIRHCKKDSICVALLRDTTTGTMHTEPKDKAELLNLQFQSVFSKNTPL